MFVFVDDSGDAGFKFGSGSSSHIVMSAVVVRSREDIKHAMQKIHEARCEVSPDGGEHVYEAEFKYAKCKASLKDKFFESARDARFDLRAIIVDKRQLYSSHLRNNPADLKSHLIFQMLTHTLGTIRDAHLIVDGQDQKSFGMSDSNYFLKRVNAEAPGTLSEVRFTDSKKSQLIQVADMTAGAIRTSLLGNADGIRHESTFAHRFKYPNGSKWLFRAR